MDVMQADNPIIAIAAHQVGMWNEEFSAMEKAVIWTVKILTISKKLKYFLFGWDRVIRMAWIVTTMELLVNIYRGN